MNRLVRAPGFAAPLVVAMMVAGSAAGAATTFANGGFESTYFDLGQINYATAATGWYVPGGGYTFVMDAAVAGNGGVNGGQYGNLDLWGGGNGGLTPVKASPNGGNFIAQDGAFEQAPLEQDIAGLTAGSYYTVSFQWAAAQQSGFTGATTEQWAVSLGGAPTQYTPVINNPSMGFTGWMKQSFTFMADSHVDTLAFSAVGAPGVPPFALLDGVTFKPAAGPAPAVSAAVPEPAGWAMMLVGLGALGAMARRRRVVIG